MYLLAQRKQKVEVARNEAINPDKSEEALSEPIEDYTKVQATGN
jgi:hypothetical protein